MTNVSYRKNKELKARSLWNFWNPAEQLNVDDYLILTKTIRILYTIDRQMGTLWCVLTYVSNNRAWICVSAVRIIRGIKITNTAGLDHNWSAKAHAWPASTNGSGPSSCIVHRFFYICTISYNGQKCKQRLSDIFKLLYVSHSNIEMIFTLLDTVAFFCG